jgi:hypothetical protein
VIASDQLDCSNLLQQGYIDLTVAGAAAFIHRDSYRGAPSEQV